MVIPLVFPEHAGGVLMTADRAGGGGGGEKEEDSPALSNILARSRRCGRGDDDTRGSNPLRGRRRFRRGGRIIGRRLPTSGATDGTIRVFHASGYDDEE